MSVQPTPLSFDPYTCTLSLAKCACIFNVEKATARHFWDGLSPQKKQKDWALKFNMPNLSFPQCHLLEESQGTHIHIKQSSGPTEIGLANYCLMCIC